MAEWLSMKDAPRDGSEIILLFGETIPDHNYVCNGSFIDDAEGERLGYWRGWLVWSQDGSSWDVLFDDEAEGWMPLPAIIKEPTP